MTREEFLEQLRSALQENLDGRQVQENVEYYKEYIIEETKKGKREEEVLQMLGDPWILARTIIDAGGGGGFYGYEAGDSYDAYESGESRYTARGGRSANASRYEGDEKHGVHITILDKWWKKLLLLLVVVMIIMLIFAVVSGLVSLFAPIIVPVIIIMIVIRLLGGRR